MALPKTAGNCEGRGQLGATRPKRSMEPGVFAASTAHQLRVGTPSGNIWLSLMDWAPLDRLGGFPAIVQARTDADSRLAAIEGKVEGHRLVPADAAMVIYGSLARREWTSGSDVDWTMMLDGAVRATDFASAYDIEDMLQDLSLKEPNPNGAFGNLCFAAELVHKVGGESDSNRNTTQRVLLLLESASVADTSGVRDRVVRAVLERYLEDEGKISGKKGAMPRFLLNDIVRYWRTMAVDFTAKQRARRGRGWALRNFKLRMSRKLIFTAGLLVCLNAIDDVQSGAQKHEKLRHLEAQFAKPPLLILAESTTKHGMADEQAAGLFAAYEKFLEILNDDEKRKALDGLRQADAQADSLFQECRGVASAFQDNLMQLFEANPALRTACIRYGVF